MRVSTELVDVGLGTVYVLTWHDSLGHMTLDLVPQQGTPGVVLALDVLSAEALLAWADAVRPLVEARRAQLDKGIARLRAMPSPVAPDEVPTVVPTGDDE